MHIVMRGKKVKCEWILLKDRREEGSKWLLSKADIELKLSKKLADTSAIRGRSMLQIAKAKDK